MITNRVVSLFFIGLSLVLFIEGLGFKWGGGVAFFLATTFPFVCFFSDLKSPSLNKIPIKATVAFGFFLIFSLISVFMTQNIIQTSTYLLFYISLGLTFLISYSYNQPIKKLLPSLILFFGGLFSVYSLFAYQLQAVAQIFRITSGYQVVFSKYQSHNHLGDFLLLPIVICLYYFFTLKRKKYLFLLIVFLLFLLFAYSRSSYLALFITLLIMTATFIKQKIIKLFSYETLLTILISSLLIFFFFITVKESSQIDLFKASNQLLVDKANLKAKYFRAKRLEFITEGLASFNDKPLFGVGPGNFIMASKIHSSTTLATFSSHNLFMDVLVENGLLAFLAFCLFLGLVFKNSPKNSLFFFLVLSLLLNFQTDYTHRIYLFFVLFFILMGLSLKDSPNNFS